MYLDKDFMFSAKKIFLNTKIPLEKHKIIANIINQTELIKNLTYEVVTFCASSNEISSKIGVGNLLIHFYLNEIVGSMNISIKLALDSYSRSAITELRFALEKLVELVFIIEKYDREGIALADKIIKGKKLKYSQKLKCNYIDIDNKLDIYGFYSLLCKVTHGEFSFFSKDSSVADDGIFPIRNNNFFELSRWYLAFIRFNEIFVNIFKQTFNKVDSISDVINRLIEVFNDYISEHGVEYHLSKDDRYCLVEYKSGEKLWLNFQGHLNSSTGEFKGKLVNDYKFILTMFDMEPELKNSTPER